MKKLGLVENHGRRGSFVEEARMAKKRKYSRGAGTEVEREMHRYKRGKAKSGKGGGAAR